MKVIRRLGDVSHIVLLATLLTAVGIIILVHYNEYQNICDRTKNEILTQRRVSDILAEFDMLGIINTQVISKGRHGRMREIKLMLAPNIKQKAKEIFESLTELTNNFTGGQEAHTEIFVKKICYSIITSVYCAVESGGERAYWLEARSETQRLKILTDNKTNL